MHILKQYPKFWFKGLSRKTFTTSIKDQILSLKNAEGNVPDKVLDAVDAKLYHQKNHPLGIIKTKIEDFFVSQRHPKSTLQERFYLPYEIRDSFSPIVTTKQCFDDLLTPADHVSRRKTDTYYINESQLLRTHTSAHQRTMIEGGSNAFVVFGDVYRRDQIDATHYPVFHQVNPPGPHS